MTVEELKNEMPNMGIEVETNTHKYIRNDDFVVVSAKKDDEIEVVKTIMPWDEFKNGIQKKIEKYN